jgi:hypothetical protein
MQSPSLKIQRSAYAKHSVDLSLKGIQFEANSDESTRFLQADAVEVPSAFSFLTCCGYFAESKRVRSRQGVVPHFRRSQRTERAHNLLLTLHDRRINGSVDTEIRSETGPSRTALLLNRHRSTEGPKTQARLSFLPSTGGQ